MPGDAKGTSLTVKITLVILAVVLVLLAGLSVFLSLLVKTDVLSLETENASREVRILASGIEQWVKDITVVTQIAAVNPTFREGLERRSFGDSDAVLSAILGTASYLRNAIIVDTNGRVVAAAGKSAIGGNAAELSTWKECAQRSASQYISVNPEAFPGDTQALISVGAPIGDSVDGILGVLIVSVDPDVFSALFASSQQFGENAYDVVFDNKGNVFVHPKPSMVLQNIGASEPYTRILKESQTRGFFPYSDSQSSLYVYYARMVTVDWFVAAIVPQVNLMQLPRRVTMVLAAGAAAAVAALVLVLALLLNAIVLRRLSLLVGGIHQASTGDLTVRSRVRGSDELGAVSRSFDELTGTFGILIAELREKMKRLKFTGDTLATNMNQTAAAIHQIDANVKSTQNQIAEQSAAVHETSAAAEQLTRSIESLGGMIENQSSAVTQSSAAIEEMITNIRSVGESTQEAKTHANKLLGVSQEGKQKLAAVAAEISEIAKHSMGLLTATRLISSISSDTNLLSMNASIEAAHAGDAGRGFAVVADEIRKLAEQAAQQSKDIAKNLKAVKSRIDSVTKNSEETEDSFGLVFDSVEKVGEIVSVIENAMREQREGGAQILAALANINQISSAVRDGSLEMKSGNEQILRVVQKLSDVNAAVKSNVAEIAAGAEEIAKAASEVAGLSAENRDLIEEVNGKAARFKVTEG